ncbi:MAG: YbjN domain-containing protein, partial [Psychrobacter celer]
SIDHGNLMSQRNKLSLWQRLKRLLTEAAPPAVVDDDNDDLRQTTIDDELNGRPLSSDKPASRLDSNSNSHIDASDNDSKPIGTAPPQPTSDSTHQSPDPTDTHIDIVECLKQYFEQKQWHYVYYRPSKGDQRQSHHLSLKMQHKQLSCGYLFRVPAENKLLAVYGILPFLIPESHQSAAMLLITQINYDMLIGNLEMDINDGEIRYKYAIDVEAVGINDDIIEHVLQSVIAMTTVAHELFYDLINQQYPAEDMQTLLTELRQQVDSRTFFLPTQYVQ